MKTITYKTTKVIKTIIATLLILVALCGVSKAENPVNELKSENNGLTIQLKAWMGDVNNWGDMNGNDFNDASVCSNRLAESEINNGEDLSTEMESWMTDNSLWDKESDNENSDLTLKMKSWISNSNLWDAEPDNNEELAVQIRQWIKNNSFINESNEQIFLCNELAAN